MRIVFLVCLLATLSLAGHAAEAPPPGAPKPSVAAPPPIPPTETRSAPAPESDTGLEPQVTITTRGGVTYEEYRINGRHYMTKVTPKRGKPYYLIDKEGNGEFRRSDLEPNTRAPNWVIKSW